MTGPQPSRAGDDVDLDELGEHGPTNFFLSFIVAFALIAGGITLIVRGDLPWLPVESFRNSGKHAIGSGIGAIGAGLILHFRVFWQTHRPDGWYTTLGIIIGLLTLIGGAVVIVMRFFRFI